MINDDTIKGTSVETTDNTKKEPLKFTDFLHKNFYNYEHYKNLALDKLKRANKAMHGWNASSDQDESLLSPEEHGWETDRNRNIQIIYIKCHKSNTLNMYHS